MVVIDELSLSMKHVTKSTEHECEMEDKAPGRGGCGPAPPCGPQFAEERPFASGRPADWGAGPPPAGQGFGRGGRFAGRGPVDEEQPFGRGPPRPRKPARSEEFAPSNMRSRMLLGVFVFLAVYFVFGGFSGGSGGGRGDPTRSYTPHPSLRGHQAVWLDLNGDGIPDAVGYDLDGDGQVDAVDTNLDGQVDSVVPQQQQQQQQYQQQYQQGAGNSFTPRQR